MKKIFILMAIAVFAFASCDGLKKSEGDTPGVIEKPENNGEAMEQLKPSEQKVKLEEVAENLMDEYPAGEFEDFFKLASRFGEKYFEEASNSYWDAFDDYWEERGESIYHEEFEEIEKHGGIYKTWSTEIFLEFAQLDCLLTLGETSASCTDYNGTKMVFSLDGAEYVVEIEASGNTVTAEYDFEDIYGYEDYYEDMMVHVKNSYHFEVLVPEKINVRITKNGSEYASVDMSFVRRFSEAGVNLTTDCFQVTTTVTIDGHSVVIDKTGYDAASGKAGVSYTLKKASDVIMQAMVTADVKVNLVTEENDWGDGYNDYVYPEFTLAKNFDIYVDILGQLQVIGTCTDGLDLSEYIENFYDSGNDSQAKRAVDNINNSIDVGIYYNKSVTCQADIIMDYYVERDDWDGTEWYELEPIIKFPDGSKYAFYEYFDEDSFEGLSSSFELWLNMYETMLEHYFE